MLRCFDDDNITHVDTTIDPVRDMEVINYELQIKDLETVESRMAKTEKAAKAGADKTAKMQLGVLAAYRGSAGAGTSGAQCADRGKRGTEVRPRAVPAHQQAGAVCVQCR